MSDANGAGMALAPVLQLDGPAQLELEHAGRGLLVRLADLMGGALGRVSHLSARGLGMPAGLQTKMRGIAETAIARAYDVAIIGLKGGTSRRAPDPVARRATQAAVVASGVVGGMTGVAGFVPDIGVTTVLIMREIARIAREEGEDLATPDARRACLEVFALRGLGSDPSDSGVGYFSARMVMRGTPMVMLVGEVSSRYGLALSQKFSLQMVPVAGALAGASLNAAFLAHYRDLARAHFTVRRLERQHGNKVREVAALIRERIAARVPTT